MQKKKIVIKSIKHTIPTFLEFFEFYVDLVIFLADVGMEMWL